MKLPFILILDIDSTVIGTVSPNITEEHYLLITLRRVCLKNKDLTANCINSETMDIQDELKNGLLRPNFKEFLLYCNKKFKNLEVFFYTNASYSWANNITVRSIEEAVDYKVNRPIFTKENSLITESWNNTKTIANIYPSIVNTLNTKYPALNKQQYLKQVFEERMIFIDDIKDNLVDYTHRQIQCPEYNFMPYYNIYEKLVNKYNIPKYLFENKEVLEYMHTNNIPIYTPKGNEYQQDEEYMKIMYLYYLRFYEIKNKESKSTEDRFFINLMKQFDKIGDDGIITNKQIIKINKLLNPVVVSKK